MKNNKLYIGLTSGLVVGSLVGSLLTSNGVINSDETLATVGNEKITSVELYESMKELYGVATLDTLISDTLIDLESEKNKVEVTDKELQKELDAIELQYGGEENLKAELGKANRTLDDLEEDVEIYLKMQELIKERIEVTDEEIKAYFEKNKESLSQQEEVKASHILVDDEKTAEIVVAKLADGESFEKLAREYSTDSGSKESGGDLGFFGRGEMVPEFEKAAFSTKVGTVSDPVKSQFGYHIIKVIDKKDAKEAKLEESKEVIKNAIKEDKMATEYASWFEEMKKEYKVVNKLETSDKK